MLRDDGEEPCGLTHRPQYAVFPEDEGGFANGDQYYVGDSGLLVKPVVVEGATKTDVYIADNQVSSRARSTSRGAARQ
jgi:hypothetical protein